MKLYAVFRAFPADATIGPDYPRAPIFSLIGLARTAEAACLIAREHMDRTPFLRQPLHPFQNPDNYYMFFGNRGMVDHAKCYGHALYVAEAMEVRD